MTRAPAWRRHLVDACPLVAAVLWVLVTGLLTIRMGLNHEEFRDLLAFRRTADGLVMGRDFNWGYGPLGLYLFTGLLRATAFEVIAYRAVALAIAALGVCLAYRVARGLRLSPAWSALAATLAFSLFTFPAYTYNHWLTTVANLAAVVCVQRALAGAGRRWLAAAGVCVGVSVLVKPIPIGLGAALAMVVFLGLARRVDPALGLPPRDALGRWSLGFFGAVVPPVAMIAALAGVTRVLPAGLAGRVAESYVPPRLIGLVPTRLWEIDWQLGSYAIAREIVLALNQAYGVLLFWGGLVYLPAVVGALLAYRVGRRAATATDGALGLLALMTVLAGAENLLTGTMTGVAAIDAGYVGSAHSVGAYTLPLAFIPGVYLVRTAVATIGAAAARRWLGVAARGAGVALVMIAIALPNLRAGRALVERWPAVALPGVEGVRVSPETMQSTIRALAFLRAHTSLSDTIWVTTYAPIFSFVSGRPSVVPEDDFVVHFNPGLLLSERNFPAWSGPPMRAADFVLQRIDERRPAALVVGDVHGRAPRLDPRLAAYLERHYAKAVVFEAPPPPAGVTGRRERWDVYLAAGRS
jgi:hypothetical protein